ncbi:MAG TPA: DUF6676 family protein [Acidimicrobiia bacterium]|nr:DUF6676 family protein [Acidimicrobiia bacterium]
MKRLAALAAIALFLFPALPASAQTPDDVAQTVSDTGLYVAPGLEANTSSISASVTRARNAGVRMMVVLLDADPTGGATTFADAILDRVPGGTVLVLSATNEGMSSTEFGQADMQAALDAGFAASSQAASGEGDAAFVSATVDSLTGTTASGSGTNEVSLTSSGGSGGLIILVAIVGGFILIIWFAMRRSRKTAESGKKSAIDEARSEIKAQLESMANTLLDITDLVSASASSNDDTYLRQASETFTTASDSFETALDLTSLEALSDRLDEARWQLDAAGAIAAGKPVPAQPAKEQRYVCFFDPTHPGATETAQITTPAGSQTVRVCKDCAGKLQRGEQPQPRMINVGGQRVPAANAPRSYGGGGFDWLSVFSVLAGGMGQGAAYDWGRSSTRRRTGMVTRSTPRSTSSGTGTPVRRSSASSTRQRAGRVRKRNR